MHRSPRHLQPRAALRGLVPHRCGQALKSEALHGLGIRLIMQTRLLCAHEPSKVRRAIHKQLLLYSFREDSPRPRPKRSEVPTQGFPISPPLNQWPTTP